MGVRLGTVHQMGRGWSQELRCLLHTCYSSQSTVLFPVLLKASQAQDNPHQNTERVPSPLQLGGVRDLEPTGEGVGRVYTPGL